MRLLGDTNIDFMKYRKFWISISLVLIAVFFFAVFFIHFNLAARCKIYSVLEQEVPVAA